MRAKNTSFVTKPAIDQQDLIDELIAALEAMVNYYGTAPFHNDGKCEPGCPVESARAAITRAKRKEE